MGAKVIGLVVPEAADSIPAESVLMYAGITFIARGIALRSLSAPTPSGKAKLKVTYGS